MVVSTLEDRDIREIFQARRLIELAAVDATPEATPEQLARIRKASEAFIAAIEAGERNRSHHADIEVHASLVGVLGSTRLSRVHAGLMGELRLALTAQYESPPDGSALVQRHREFVALIAAGRTAQARSQLAERLDHAEGRLLAALREAHPPEAASGDRSGHIGLRRVSSSA